MLAEAYRGQKTGFFMRNREVLGTVLKTGCVCCEAMYWKEAFIFVLLDDKDTRTYWTTEKHLNELSIKLGDRISVRIRQRTGHLYMLKKL